MERSVEVVPSRMAFVRTRLGSLLAVAPLGVWTVVHVWDNLAGFEGAAAWERAVTGHAHPAAHALTATVVFAPLLIHTVWGLQRLATSRPNLGRYKTYDNLKYALQRLSAIGVLLFIGAHVLFLLVGLWAAKRAADAKAPFASVIWLYVLSQIVFLTFFGGAITMKMAVLIEQTLMVVMVGAIAARK